VQYSGKMYNTESWPAVAGLQHLVPNTAWFTDSYEGPPTTPETWETFGPTSVFYDTAYETIRFAIDGALAPNSNEAALIQFTDVTVSMEADNIPTISVGAEAAINFFDFKITNNTSGEYLMVTTPGPLNMALTIDCANKEAYLADGTRVVVRLSTDREAWLDLAAGSNTLEFTDVGTVAITGTVSHRDRVL
jgi:phage-related protein